MDIFEIIRDLTLNHWILILLGILIGILIGFILKGTVNFNNAQKSIDKVDRKIMETDKTIESLTLSIHDAINLINIAPELEDAREELDSLHREIQLLESGDFKVEKKKIDGLIKSLEKLAIENLEETAILHQLIKNKDFESAQESAEHMDQETKKARAKVEKYTRPDPIK